MNGGAPTIVYYDSRSVIHANGILGALGNAILKRENKGDPLSIQVTWYAENMETRRRQLLLAPGPRQLVS